MDRNLNRRVEVAVPIVEPKLKQRVMTEALDWALADNTNAWMLDSNGDYTRSTHGKSRPFHLQDTLINTHTD